MNKRILVNPKYACKCKEPVISGSGFECTKCGQLIDFNTDLDKEQAMRFNENKLKWSLMDFKSFEPMIRVLMYGTEKYDRDNWKKGLPVTEIIDSMIRHLIQLKEKEDNDQESGLPHIGHIQCNAMFLSYMLTNKPKFDDRKIKSKQPAFISGTDPIPPSNSIH